MEKNAPRTTTGKKEKAEPPTIATVEGTRGIVEAGIKALSESTDQTLSKFGETFNAQIRRIDQQLDDLEQFRRRLAPLMAYFKSGKPQTIVELLKGLEAPTGVSDEYAKGYSAALDLARDIAENYAHV